MNILQAIILGIVQGMGEFLPISSTAHLILVPWFLGWKDPGLAFDVALHLGTLIAVVSFFWQDWIDIFKLTFQKKSIIFEKGKEDYPKNLLWFLIIACVPGALFGFLFESRAETIFRNPFLIAGMLVFGGYILYWADKYALKKKNITEVSLKDSILIGLSQAIALLPGISRSGATITAGLFVGLTRESAARFSFLLSTPIIVGAALVKVPHLFEEGITEPLIFGIVASAVSGYYAIKYLLKFVQKDSYVVFFWYRLTLAIFIGIVYFLK